MARFPTLRCFGMHPASSGTEPCHAATNAPVAQLDRAPDYESGGRTFESFRARQFGTELGMRCLVMDLTPIGPEVPSPSKAKRKISRTVSAWNSVTKRCGCLVSAYRSCTLEVGRFVTICIREA
jgi:hypothetical protein